MRQFNFIGGNNKKAAKLSGINVEKVLIENFALMGVISGNHFFKRKRKGTLQSRIVLDNIFFY